MDRGDLAVEGKMVEAERILGKVYGMDPRWRHLPGRLLTPGLLEVDPDDVRRLEATGPVKDRQAPLDPPLS